MDNNMKTMHRSFLVDGDPMSPCSSDLIAQTALIAVGSKIPDGWRVLTGSATCSKIARVVFRFEIDEE